MFTLGGLILQARENLFREIWSPFSIYFIFLLRVMFFLKRAACRLGQGPADGPLPAACAAAAAEPPRRPA